MVADSDDNFWATLVCVILMTEQVVSVGKLVVLTWTWCPAQQVDPVLANFSEMPTPPHPTKPHPAPQNPTSQEARKTQKGDFLCPQAEECGMGHQQVDN